MAAVTAVHLQDPSERRATLTFDLFAVYRAARGGPIEREEWPMSLIIGLDHVNLLIDSGDDALARARAFYQELLGLEPLESFPTAGGLLS